MVQCPSASLAKSSAISASARKECASNTASTTTRSKLYDKAFTILGSVLRAEGTLNNVEDFRVYRPKEGDAEGELSWRPLRRGIADLHRRAEVSRKATERYLDALASVDQDTTLEEVLHQLGHPTRRPPTLSLGESQTPPAPSPWPDLQGQRYAPLPPHQGRTHSHHCHPHCPPLQRASTHRRSRMNLCSTTTISGVSSTEPFHGLTSAGVFVGAAWERLWTAFKTVAG